MKRNLVLSEDTEEQIMASAIHQSCNAEWQLGELKAILVMNSEGEV